MKILIYSPVFYPSMGGLETVIDILAHQFHQAGHEIKVVSQTPDSSRKVFPFEVIRQPSFLELWQLTQWCDLFFQGSISLKGIWPVLLARKPLVVTHQTWYQRLDSRIGWQDYLKLSVSRFATNICASSSLAKSLPAPSHVIPNPYREDVFYERPEIPRTQELAFLGRLVSDKGADLLLDALSLVKQAGLTPKLTIIGKGVEEANLRQQVERLNLTEQVKFVGAKFDQELAEILNSHQILVVPSRWAEPFGIVAIEGIACGCVVVGSDQGGLTEAIGNCGVTFPNGDANILAKILIDLLQNPDQLSHYRTQAANHLARHTASVIAQAYLEILEQI